ncbi:ubiquitin carboxyl-terminal hydrolase 30-like [Antedon mediterranea]|uniref:ubiquitin carboxyl-terminal hydrolase 30-like n=1 Tax=Antedon mediterranea TaxID=105859 RepID=UPI003AF97213
MINHEKLAFLTGLATLAVSAVAAYIFCGPDETKGKRRKVAGLENLGNTCYLNTIIQSLAACRPFIRWLDHLEGNHKLAFMLLKLLKAVNTNEITATNSPQKLLDVLHESNWWYGGQQDAHELFQFIISELDSNQQHLASHISLFQPSLLYLEKEALVHNMKSKFELQLMKVSASVEQPFHGSLANHLTCTLCKTKKPISLTTFDTLSLPIPTQSWGTITLEDLLQTFTQSELVQDVTCLKCSGKLGRTRIREDQDNWPDVRKIFKKQMTISKVPQCLCIHLQRMSWQANGAPIRKDEYVQYPEHLNMHAFSETQLLKKRKRMKVNDKTINKTIKKSTVRFIGSTMLPCHRLHYCSIGSLPNHHIKDKQKISNCAINKTEIRRSTTSDSFKLMAAIVHVGDAYSGHFLTYRRSPGIGEEASKDWLCISDRSVRSARTSEMLSQKAYMLYYERQ